MARKFGLVLSIIFLSVFLGSFLRIVEFNLNLAPVRNEALVLGSQSPPNNQQNNISNTVSVVLPSQRVVIWHHAWGEKIDNILALGESNFITHVAIGNLDFNEQPTIDSKTIAKINAVKDAGLTPILTRWLFFQDGKNATIPEAAPFLDSYADGSIVRNGDYFAWFLKKLRAEADLLGIDLIAVDTEPHFGEGASTNFKETVLQAQLSPAVYAEIASAVNQALTMQGVEKADYIHPSDSFGKVLSGYRALSDLGKVKINLSTYRDCPLRLDPTTDPNYQPPFNGDVLGIWVTVNPTCYRPVGGTCSSGTHPNCPIALSSMANAFWLPASIFQNVEFWYNQNRGLFLYPSSNDNALFPDQFNIYCQNNLAICNQYNYSGKTITDTTKPSTPTYLVAGNVSPTSITFSWLPSTDNVAVAKYRIYRDRIQLTEVITPTFIDSSLPSTQSVSYQVSAFDAQGNASPLSVPLVLSPSAPPLDNTPPVISNIQILKATNSALVSWATNEPADSRVNYGLSSNPYSRSVYKAPLTQSRLINVTGLQPGTTYHYQLVSRDASGNTASTQDATFKTLGTSGGGGGGADTQAPPTPTGLTVTALSSSEIKISWSPTSDSQFAGQTTSGVVGYNLYLNSGTTPFTFVTGTSYQQHSLTPDTTYLYRVSAVDGAGNESPISAAVSATTLSSNTSSDGGGGGVGGGDRGSSGGNITNQTTSGGTLTQAELQARITELQRIIIFLIQRLIAILTLRVQGLSQ